MTTTSLLSKHHHHCRLTTAFDLAMQLNNEGTNLLAIGQDDRALAAFKHALLVIQQDLPPPPLPSSSTEENGDHEQENEEHEEDEMSSTATVGQDDEGREESSSSSGNPQSTTSSSNTTTTSTTHPTKLRLTPIHLECPNLDNSYVYNRALAVRDGQGGQGKKEMNLLSAVIIFNMALLHDLRGIKCHSTRFRIRSLRLYEMSYGLLEEFQQQVPESTSGAATAATATASIDTILLLTVVCLNNMSQVAFAESDFARGQWMLRNLQTLLRSSPFYKPNYLNEQDIRGLMLNVMMMHPPTSASAA